MALFGSSKKTPAIKKVRPTVVRTQNVAKELFKIAKSYEMEPELLDFNLLDVQTYTRLISEENRETEWEEISKEESQNFHDESLLLNPFFQIKQTYEIEVFSKKASKDDHYSNLKLAVGANATKCKVYLSIAQGSKVDYVPHFEQDLIDMINRKKIRAGILVYMFDAMVEGVASKISARVRIAEKLEFEQSETHLIAEAYEPTVTRNDELILHYEDSKEVEENERVDYASRGFIQSVQKGQLLIEYVKAKMGKPGRNCRGEYMEPKEPIVAHEPNFKVSENIKVVEDEDSIKYYANENGYIAFEDNTYVIKKEVDVDAISFKTTGSIDSGVDSEVNITVKETDAIKDAVGSGMTVEVTEIEIDGNVGSNAKVIAKKASIGGQTHKAATVIADELEINVHKGKAYGKNIHITRLEHGQVEGEVVEVAQAIGGIIRAKEVEIGICASHVKATASNTIEIKKMLGSENVFTIDPLLSRDIQNSVEDNEEQIKELELRIRELKKEIEKYTSLIKNGTKVFLEIKKRLLHYQKNNVKMPESFVKKYKQFQNMQQRLKELKDEYTLKQEKLNLLTTRTASFQDNIMDARIINRDKWIGYNEIKFRLVDPPIELVYKPLEGSSEKVFGLVELNDGEYAIRPVAEEG
ncbi:flagellar assembly protein A [Sulfurimonas sp. NWX79]|uniref:flagellar assembly protein A n=1 Tax=Sulfurimonas sp. NWX79 TaxID=2925412 RepID=UPI003204D609